MATLLSELLGLPGFRGFAPTYAFTELTANWPLVI